MTLTIDLTPQEAAHLAAAARQVGLAPTALLKKLAAQIVLTDEAAAVSSLSGEALLEEYHDLVDEEMEGRLSEAQTVRLHDVQQELNNRDAQEPGELAINARLQQTEAELDAMLDRLTRLPDKAA